MDMETRKAALVLAKGIHKTLWDSKLEIGIDEVVEALVSIKTSLAFAKLSCPHADLYDVLEDTQASLRDKTEILYVLTGFEEQSGLLSLACMTKAGFVERYQLGRHYDEWVNLGGSVDECLEASAEGMRQIIKDKEQEGAFSSLAAAILLDFIKSEPDESDVGNQTHVEKFC